MPYRGEWYTRSVLRLKFVSHISPFPTRLFSRLVPIPMCCFSILFVRPSDDPSPRQLLGGVPTFSGFSYRLAVELCLYIGIVDYSYPHLGGSALVRENRIRPFCRTDVDRAGSRSTANLIPLPQHPRETSPSPCNFFSNKSFQRPKIIRLRSCHDFPRIQWNLFIFILAVTTSLFLFQPQTGIYGYHDSRLWRCLVSCLQSQWRQVKT